MMWLAWDHVCTLKCLGGASILNLYEHMVACQFNFSRFMFEGVQPWTKMVAYFIKKIGIKLENMMVEAIWWNVINSERDVKCTRSMIVKRLLTSLAKYIGICAMASSTRKGMCQLITNGGFGDIKVVEMGM